VDRRTFVLGATTIALGPAGWLYAAAAGRVPRVFIHTGQLATKEAFAAGLRELGWVNGQNILIDLRLRREGEEETTVRAELARAVQDRVDVLVMGGPNRIRAAMHATQTIPIVGFDLESDPVASGFVKSLARPGTNASGLWLDLPEIAGKQLQFLREVMPHLDRVGVVWDDRIGRPQFSQTESAARALNMTLRAVSLHSPANVDEALKRLLGERPQAILLLTAPAISQALPRLAEVARQHHLPSISPFSTYPGAGGLMAYGPDFLVMWRQMARYVDRILKGAKVSELPVERPAKFVLTINVQTARSIGLTIPPSLLLRADHVIE
jgi:putative tryptophan/tyrosine transport system substrate-binding protein